MKRNESETTRPMPSSIEARKNALIFALAQFWDVVDGLRDAAPNVK